MKEYFKFFKVPFILVAALAVISAVVFAVCGSKATEKSRNNDECTTERVFDYADKLTDEEENKLRQLIAQKEKETECDIVIVTLNESLEDYVSNYTDTLGEVPMDQWVMVYADNFYDENAFGYNAPHGDGVLFLDNWYREADGHVYSWMSTSGKAYDTYSSEMIDSILNDSLENVDSDPYGAYATFVEYFAIDMNGGSAIAAIFSIPVVFAVSLIVALIFLAINWSGKKGESTVNEATYVVGGKPEMKTVTDQFLRKTVTKRHIERDNSGSSGGGGGHVSSGGFSHGGGGHSR